MADMELGKFVKEIRADRKLTPAELREAIVRYDRAVEACRLGASEKCAREKLEAEFLFMGKFEEMLRPYKILGKEDFDRLSRLVQIVNATRVAQGKESFRIDTAVADFYADSGNAAAEKAVSLSGLDIRLDAASDSKEAANARVVSAEQITPDTYLRFRIISSPEYRDLPKEAKDAIRERKDWKNTVEKYDRYERYDERTSRKFQSLVRYYGEIFREFAKIPQEGQEALRENREWKRFVSGKEDYSEKYDFTDGTPLRLARYFQKIFEPFSKLSDEMKRSVRKSSDWRYYVEGDMPSSSWEFIEGLARRAEISRLYESLPESGKTAAKENDLWKRFFDGGDSEYSWKALLELLTHFSEFFPAFDRLDEKRKREIKASSEWKTYVVRGVRDERAELLGLVEYGDPSLDRELNSHGLYRLKYSRDSVTESSDPPDANTPGAVKIPPIELSQEKTDGGKYREPNGYDPDTQALSLYFPTNVAALDRFDIRDLTSYLDGIEPLLRKTRTLVIEGYADARGNPTANQSLSERRTQTVRNALLEYGRRHGMDFVVKTVSFGDMRATGNKNVQDPETALARDRKAVITPHSANFLRTAVERTRGTNVYLIDGSSSMDEKLSDGSGSRMDAVKLLPFDPSAQFYRFSSSSKRRVSDLGKTPSEDLAYGSTPLLHALGYAVEKNPGGRITIVSDGMWTDGASEDSGMAEFHAIMQRARASNTRINVIGIGIPTWLRKIYQDLALRTGGEYAIEHE